MSDLLSIGSSGVTAYQRALATVSNNIANVNTDGYTRQDVSLAANQPRQLGGSYLGTGARFDSVQRQYDAFVESNLRNSNSDLQSQKPLLSYVNRLIDVMGDESIGLTTAMNRFFESARDLSSAMPMAWLPAFGNWQVSSRSWTTRPASRSKPMWAKPTP
jgi:flagellar hook-associated protein FlgK